MSDASGISIATVWGAGVKIASIEVQFPRGKYMGTPFEPLTEASRFRRCELCHGYVDILDLAWVRDHEGPLPHPAQDRVQ
jgi:hypothetical protein